jgi:hypothetical protein
MIGLMVAGSVMLWVGLPLLWLWIGSHLQESQGHGRAIMITFFGAIGSIVALAVALGWLNHRHSEIKEARGEPAGKHSALGLILVSTATICLSVFGVWFLIFAGANFAPVTG